MTTMATRRQTLCFLLLAVTALQGQNGKELIAASNAAIERQAGSQQQAAQSAIQASVAKQGAAVAAFGSSVKVPGGDRQPVTASPNDAFFLLPPLPAPAISAN